jgi:hypothetical protein
VKRDSLLEGLVERITLNILRIRNMLRVIHRKERFAAGHSSELRKRLFPHNRDSGAKIDRNHVENLRQNPTSGSRE